MTAAISTTGLTKFYGSRCVVDSLTPGWQQIGAVWLPLPHLIYLIPTQIDIFYRTGAFGSLVSILCFGVTTYAANRSLRVSAPDSYGTVVLDFNRATNLPCAYTEFATCPLPPAENRLPVAVEAGELIPREAEKA